MSNSSRTDRTPFVDDLLSVPSSSALRKPLTGAAFWAAITLPFLHVPLLVTGLESQTTVAAFLILVALNVITLYVGHSYRHH